MELLGLLAFCLILGLIIRKRGDNTMDTLSKGCGCFSKQMQFPSLETMVMYGVYTIRDLILYSENKLVQRNIRVLNECEACSFVFEGCVCNNCNSIKRDTRMLIR